MSQLVRRSLATLVAVTLIGALGACSDDEPSADGDPTPTPTPSETSPSASPTPTGPVEPDVPDAMNLENKAGAKAFVKYYWDVVNYAQATGDVKTLRTLHSKGCFVCKGGQSRITEIYDSGGRIEGGRHTPNSLQVRELQNADGEISYQVTFAVSHGIQKVIGAGGKIKDRFDAGTVRIKVVARMSDDARWRLSYWEPLS